MKVQSDKLHDRMTIDVSDWHMDERGRQTAVKWYTRGLT